MGDYRSKEKTVVNMTEPEKQNGEAETFLEAPREVESCHFSPPPMCETISAEEGSEKMYKVVTLVFALLIVLWIVLLIVLRTTPPAQLEEMPCESQEESLASIWCLPSKVLPPQLRSSSCPPDAETCCTNNLVKWRDFVTAFVNVEFAKRKRAPEDKPVSSTDNQGSSTRVRRATNGKETLESLQVKDNGTYFVSAELTLDFKQNVSPVDVSCRIQDTVIPAKASPCSVTSNATCMMPFTIGGLVSLKSQDTVFLEIDKLSNEDYTKKVCLLKVVKVD